MEAAIEDIKDFVFFPKKFHPSVLAFSIVLSVPLAFLLSGVASKSPPNHQNQVFQATKKSPSNKYFKTYQRHPQFPSISKQPNQNLRWAKKEGPKDHAIVKRLVNGES